MFSDIAPVYDLLKSHRDYVGEAEVIRDRLHRYIPQARALVEVACGTGSLLAKLHEFTRAGVDASSQMLSIAQKKLGSTVTLQQGRMEDFSLPRPAFEVLLCLDGAIGYVSSADLERTFSNFARHMVSGGLLVLEPWYTPGDWLPGQIHVVHRQGENTTAIRVGYGYPDGVIEFHNVVGTAEGIRTFDERYDFTLHASDSLKSAFKAAGFIEARKEAAPCFGRGLWVARVP